jgi:hypothetical protein
MQNRFKGKSGRMRQIRENDENLINTEEVLKSYEQ